jgi:hypothetical protein
MVTEMRTKPRLGDEHDSPRTNHQPVWKFDEGGSTILSVSHPNERIIGRVLLVQGGWVARGVFGVVLDGNGIKLHKTKRNAAIALLNRLIPAPSDRPRLLAEYDAFEASFNGKRLTLEQVARLAAIYSPCCPAEDGEAAFSPSSATGSDDSTDDNHVAQRRSLKGEQGEEINRSL